GPGGAPSSRPKDLVDLVLLATHEPFLADELRAALEQTFSARGTHPLPGALPPPPAEWARPYAELAEQVGIAPELDDGYRRARSFLDPILGGTATESGRWIVAAQEWGQNGSSRRTAVRIVSRRPPSHEAARAPGR